MNKIVSANVIYKKVIVHKRSFKTNLVTERDGIFHGYSAAQANKFQRFYLIFGST